MNGDITAARPATSGRARARGGRALHMHLRISRPVVQGVPGITATCNTKHLRPGKYRAMQSGLIPQESLLRDPRDVRVDRARERARDDDDVAECIPLVSSIARGQPIGRSSLRRTRSRGKPRDPLSARARVNASFLPARQPRYN